MISKNSILIILLIPALSWITSCKSPQTALTTQDSTAVIDSVQQLTANINRDLATKGPVVWLDYFDNSPQFFMAADGQLSFHDYHSARAFIKDTLVKNMTRIMLKWNSMRVDPLTRQIAAIGSVFHEDITLANGQTLPFDGYFSATAILTDKGWKLRNAHWSMKAPAK